MKKQNPALIHVTAYYPPHLGGMENCIQKIAQILAEKKYLVEVFSSDQGLGNFKKSKEKHLRVNYLKSIELAHTPIIFSLFFKLIQIPKNSIMHVHISQAITPEIVYFVSKIRKIPYVSHIHMDVDQSGPFGFLLKPYKKYILQRVLFNSTKIICLSEAQKEIISNMYHIDKSKIVILRNGVDDKYFLKRNVSAKAMPTILFVGRLSTQKNVLRLINAFNLMKTQAYLRIVGEGEERKQIEQLIAELKLTHVTLVGRKSGNELLEEYKNADIFVLSSNKEGGAPLVLLEAMATGLPAVVSDIYGISELLGDSVYLVKNPSPQNFADALDKMVSSQDLQRVYSKKSEMQIQNYRWNNTVKKLEQIYLDLVN